MTARATIAALSAFSCSQAASGDVARTPGEWQLLNGDLDGSPACVIAGLADDNTYLTAAIDRNAQSRNIVQLSFMNPDWSLKPGDSTGEIAVKTPHDSMVGTPPAFDHGFSFYVNADSFLTWAKSASKGLWLERNGKIVAQFVSGNLAKKAQDLLTCGTGLVDRDPFKK